MKNAPFLTSSVLALVAVILSFVSFGASQKNGTMQAELIKMQDDIQMRSQKFQVQNAEAQRMAQTIQTTQAVVERANPILQQAGYSAAKNKNEKLKALLARHKLDKFIPSDEDVKKIDKQLQDAEKAQQGQAGQAPAARTTPPANP
jgi:hypothetical protein